MIQVIANGEVEGVSNHVDDHRVARHRPICLLAKQVGRSSYTVAQIDVVELLEQLARAAVGLVAPLVPDFMCAKVHIEELIDRRYQPLCNVVSAFVVVYKDDGLVQELAQWNARRPA